MAAGRSCRKRCLERSQDRQEWSRATCTGIGDCRLYHRPRSALGFRDNLTSRLAQRDRRGAHPGLCRQECVEVRQSERGDRMSFQTPPRVRDSFGQSGLVNWRRQILCVNLLLALGNVILKSVGFALGFGELAQPA